MTIQQLITESKLDMKLKEIKEKFTLSDDDLEKMINIIDLEMTTGLQNEDKSSLGMLPTYVNALPNGSERGCYLALDLGGTNFRVLLVKIDDTPDSAKPKIEMINELFMVPEEVKVGVGEAFFDHIAKCMASFCQNNGLSDTYLPVGFTFSFPLLQSELNSAILLHWNKGFEVSGVAGNDVVKMLHDAIKRRGDLNCEVVAIVNDTVGTMMACALDEPDCNIGLIVGTGLNACYMESMANIDTVNCVDKAGEMCINMELGGLGDNGVLETFRNEYDNEVDGSTINKNCQLFEKMVSGKYLGEIVRVVLCDLVRNAGLFGGEISKKLFQKSSFLTAFVSEIESSWKRDEIAYHTVRNVFNSLDISPTDEECDIVMDVCHWVSSRAAYLCAAGVTSIAKRIKSNSPLRSNMKITVGVDGTMYKRHPNFSKHVTAKVNELSKDYGFSLDFVLSHDGSGKGAAVIAAAMCNKV